MAWVIFWSSVVKNVGSAAFCGFSGGEEERAVGCFHHEPSLIEFTSSRVVNVGGDCVSEGFSIKRARGCTCTRVG